MRGNDTAARSDEDEPSTFDARPIRTSINTRSDSTDGPSYSHFCAATAISTEGGAVSWAVPWGVAVIGTMSNSYFIDRRVKDCG
jgi:hypothetical protein